MRTILVAGAILVASMSFAQDSGTDGDGTSADGIYGYGGSTDDAPQYNDLAALEAAVLANSKDWYVGGEAMLFLPVLRIGLGGQVMYRYDSRPVFEQVEGNHYRQYREKRWIYGLLVHREFLFGAIGPYVRAGFGSTSGDYQGSENDPEANSTWILGAGVMVRLGAYSIRAGYQYASIPNFPDNFISMGIGRRF